MFRPSSPDDTLALRELWKKCFDADPAFLDLYFGKGKDLCRTFVLEEHSAIVSALSVFDINDGNSKGGYVYGVCTHPAYRGRRYAVSLLKYVEDIYFRKGYEFFILRPASPTLFSYYRNIGYDRTLYVDRLTEKLPPIPTELPLKPLSGERLYILRKRMCRQSQLFEWSEDMCRYILSYIDYCDGLAYETYDGAYLICIPDTETAGNIICEEWGQSGDSRMDLIKSAAKTLFTDAQNIIFKRPSAGCGEEYALYTTFTNHNLSPTILFNFTME